jgi:GNAT superfamily N-acetyltransferase
MSLYANYLIERTNKLILEDDRGFITYYYLSNEIAGLMIEDIYVLPEFRKNHVASDLANKLVAEAKDLGYTKCWGQVCPAAKNSTESMKVMLAWGLKLHSLSNTVIFLCKDI